jgi:hypothetical protein
MGLKQREVSDCIDGELLEGEREGAGWCWRGGSRG